MKTTRLLLPFIHGVDMQVLEYAVQFAVSCQATLVPLALIPLSEQQWAKGPRLEAIEQANDFLEAVKYKAIRAGVPVERFDVVTRDAVGSINMFAQEMACEGVLLFLQEGTTPLLRPTIVGQILEQASCTLYLVRLQPKDNMSVVRALLTQCLRWLGRWRGHQEEVSPQQALPAVEMISLIE